MSKKSKEKTAQENIPQENIVEEPKAKKEKSCKEPKLEEKDGFVQIWVKKSKLDYEKRVKELQIELLKLQKYVKESGLRILVIFEGRDAAGKGGTIKTITEHINPRGARVVALEKPSDKERTQWYFQRYVEHLPSAGEIVFFDRSWYNRAGVEPVMGFCTKEEYQDFLIEVPKFESLIAGSGVKIFKFYFSVTKEEQKRRFESRKHDPLKHFKLSPIDEKAQDFWDQYTLAEYSMFLASHTRECPWAIVYSDNKKKARLNTIRHILSQIDYPNKSKKKDIFKISEDIFKTGDQVIQTATNGVVALEKK
ncbi:MAG: polyphosphate kinase 2 [Campylobacteraceae bacterium]|jgi:polyphosphate kinase 2|nr:polyphosphate kinase 2 [Campylobacteraceae bacterium]